MIGYKNEWGEDTNLLYRKMLNNFVGPPVKKVLYSPYPQLPPFCVGSMYLLSLKSRVRKGEVNTVEKPGKLLQPGDCG